MKSTLTRLFTGLGLIISLLPLSSFAASGPSITTQPVSQSLLLGTNATFSVVASGQGTLSYQWSLNGTNLTDSTHVNGSTNATLTISNLVAEDAGNYQVVVSNSHGSVTSSNAILTVTSTNHYVALTNTTPVPPYASWGTAATNIQDAVNIARAGDQIFVAGGHYTWANSVAASATNCVAVNSAISLIGVAGPGQTLIDGTGSNRCVYLSGNATLTGFTLTNGSAPQGGGIYCAATSEVISNCILAGNVVDLTSGSGGGVSSGTLVNCTLVGNSAVLGGGSFGSILNNCILTANVSGEGSGAAYATLNNCLISSNSFFSGWGTSGGGVLYCTANDCTLVANQCSAYGGGAYSSTLSNCVLSANSSGEFAGGASYCTLYGCLLNGNSAVNSGAAYSSTLIGCQVTNNSADSNGGVSSCTLTNCVLTGNSSLFNAGGAGSSLLYNCLVAGNSCNTSAGGAEQSTLVNCTIAGNSSIYGTGGVDVSALTNCVVYFNTSSINANYSGSNNMSWCCTTPLPGDGSGDTAIGVSNLSSAPIFVDLAHGNYHLYPGSPGIDVGNNSVTPTSADIDGNLRIVNSTVDLGAYEFQNSPFIEIQPTNQTVTFGQPSVSFSVVAVGPGTLTYQWKFNGTNIAGATNATFTAGPVQYSWAGDYSVLVANSYGSAISSNALLTVISPSPPAFTTQPADQTVSVGTNITMTTLATGAPTPVYQWYFNGTPLTDGGRVSGSASANLNIANAQTNDTGSYQVIATNASGSATSSVANLTVLPPPAITIQPTNQVMSIGSTVVFNSGATSQSPWSVQWIKDGVAVVNGGRISGATSITLTISNLQMSDIGVYQFAASNSSGTTTSVPASLMILPVVVRGGYSSSNTNVPPAATNATAVAGGYEFSLALKNDGTVIGWGTDTSGQTDPPAGLGNVTAIDAGFNFGLALKDNETVIGWGDDTYGQTNVPAGLSNVVAIAAGWYYGLALKADGTVTGWGDNYFGETNIPAGLSNVVAIAAGSASALALKSDGTVIGWGFDQEGEINIPAGLSNVVAIAQGTYSGLALKSDGTVVGWGYGGAVNVPVGLSNVVAISVGENFGLALKSDGTVANWGNDYGESSISSGLSNVVSISAGRLHALALVQNPTVEVAPTIWWQGPTNNVVPTGRTLILHPYIAGSLPVNWQWYFGGTPLIGETNQFLVLTSIQPNQAGDYQFVVSNNYGSVTSLVATVFESPGFITQPTNQFTLLGSNANFTVTPAGIGPFGYRWYYNGALLTDGGRVSGSATTNLTIANIQTTDAGTYQLVATNNFGSTASAAATLTVLVPANVTTQPVNQTVLLSNSVTFFASALGTTPLNFQWYFNGVPMSNGGRISGATATNLIISNVQTSDAGSYQFVATNNYGSSTSMVATLTVHVPAIISGQPINQSILLSSNVTFSAGVIGDAPLSFQWYYNGALLTDGGRVSGSATTNLTIANIQTTDAGTYQLAATNNYGSTTSAVATLTVLVPASVTTQPVSQSALLSNSVTFFASASGTTPLNYQWYFNGAPMSNGGRISGATATNLVVSNVQTNDAGSYQLIAANSYGSSTSLVATLTVHVPAIIAVQPANQSILLSNNVTFSAAVIGDAPLSFQWYFGGAPLTDGGRVTGSATTSLTITNIQTSDAGTYQLTATNNYGSTTSVVATLTVLLLPVQITGQPASQAVLLGSNATFTVTANGSALNYQWYFDGTPLTDGGRISGSATPALSIANIQNSDAGGYVVMVTNLSSSAKSLTASLTPQSVLAPSVRYVALTSTNPLPPYLDWTTAATNIQDAIDAAVAGDLVLVNDGVYSNGLRAVYAASTNRIAINKAIAVQSVNGPGATTIAGFNAAGLSANYFIRCAYLTNDASLVGFTLTRGGSGSGDLVLSRSGGGAWCESSTAIISNCVLTGNVALQYGGGIFGGTLINCMIISNTANLGGGACSNTLINCTLAYNTSSFQSLNVGGGALSCNLSNCLLVANLCRGGGGGGAALSTLASCVVSNNVANNGGGLVTCVAYNSLISSNRASVYGGGAYSNALYNCILTNNYAEWGGAAAYSTLNQCVITGNRAQNYGGGTYSGSVDNSLFWGNTAGLQGTAAYVGTLRTCTVVSNLTPASVGLPAISGGALTNCIVYDNVGGNIINSKIIANTCSSPLIVAGFGNFTNAPLFVNEAGGDLHLQSNSPCINAGNNTAVSGTNDLDGNLRIVGGTVDIGCYEYQSPASVISYAWLQQYGLPTDGSADYADSDGDGMNNYAEWKAGTNPTNALSVLRLAVPASTNNANGIVVTWQSLSGITYYLQRSSDLTQPFTAIVSNLVGQAGFTSYTDTSATNASPYFYRVGVQ